jgi:periplasmic protein TonB
MLNELLRDVLRTDAAVSRSPRRWFLFPLSLVVHAIGALAYVIVPLAAEVTPPTPAPQFVNRRWVVPVAPPTPAPPRPVPPVGPVPSNAGAPIVAPAKILPEVVSVPGIPAPGALDTIGGTGVGVPVADAPVTGLTASPLPTPPQVPDRRLLKVGGSIRAPKRIAASAPIYPPVAMSARVDGVVILEAMIDEQGRVDQVRVLKSVPLLDSAAVDAVRTWRYTPTLLNGVPVAVLMTVTVNFSLQR